MSASDETPASFGGEPGTDSVHLGGMDLLGQRLGEALLFDGAVATDLQRCGCRCPIKQVGAHVDA